MELEILSNIYNERFHNALQKKEQITPPIWMMRQAGRYHKHYQNLKKKYTFEQLCRNPELACEVTLGPIKDFDFDAAILFSDILFPLDFLGMKLSFSPGPIFENNLSQQMLSKYNIEEFQNYIQFQKKSLQLIRENLAKDKSLIGFVGGPITLYHFAIRDNPIADNLFSSAIPVLERILYKIPNRLHLLSHGFHEIITFCFWFVAMFPNTSRFTKFVITVFKWDFSTNVHTTLKTPRCTGQCFILCQNTTFSCQSSIFSIT